jgi:hypothetical protein
VPVVLSNFDNTGILAWEWTLLDRPAASAASIAGAASPIASITPDVPGSYLVRLRTWLDAGMTALDDVDKGITFVRYVAAPTWRIPAAGETVEVDPSRGWADEVNEILAFIQANLGATAVGTTKFHLRVGDAIVVPADYQYLIQGAIIIDAGASLTAAPGAQIVTLP